MGNKKRATCLAASLQNELNSDVAHFTTHIKPVLQQIRLLRGLNVGGKRRNISIQLVILLPIFRTFGSPDPDRVSDQRLSFSSLVFRPGLSNPYPLPDLAWAEITWVRTPTKRFLTAHFEFA